jgi:hypothetical protein
LTRSSLRRTAARRSRKSCDIAIDRGALPFEDRAPAVDHIVRATEGGGDGLYNLRAMHRWCNLRREHFLFVEDDVVAEAARARFA